MKLALTHQMRVGHVKRWHMVRVMREQTLGEHLARVQLIAMDVLDEYAKTDDRLRLQVLQWALWHDMPEVVTGDVSPPYKSMMREHNYTLAHTIDKSIDERFETLSRKSNEIAQIVVKFADLAEAALFLEEEGWGHRAVEIKCELDDSVKSLIAKTSEEMLGDLAEALTVTYRKLINEKSYQT